MQALNNLPPKIELKVMVVVLGFIWIFLIVGLAAPVYSLSNDAQQTTVTLFHQKSCDKDGNNCKTTSIGDMKGCDPVKSHNKAAAAFEIIALFMVMGAAALVALEHLEKFKMPIVTLGLSGGIAFLLMLCWAILSGGYNAKCSDEVKKSLNDLDYKYGGGWVMVFLSWLFFTPWVVVYAILQNRRKLAAMQTAQGSNAAPLTKGEDAAPASLL